VLAAPLAALAAALAPAAAHARTNNANSADNNGYEYMPALSKTDYGKASSRHRRPHSPSRHRRPIATLLASDEARARAPRTEAQNRLPGLHHDAVGPAVQGARWMARAFGAAMR
jgi:hypothetical protein